MTGGLKRLFPEGFGLLNVIDGQSEMPTAEARDGFCRALQSASARILRAGVVIEGTGFQAAAVRAFTTGVHLFLGRPFPLRCFHTVGEAAPWLAEGLPVCAGKQTQAREIVAAIHALRAESQPSAHTGPLSPDARPSHPRGVPA
jgi:hypothetical protein